MAYNPQNPNGQAIMANSEPIVIASDQSAIPTISNQLAATSAAWTSGTSNNTAITQTGLSGYGTASVSFVVSGSITGGGINFEGYDGTNWWSVPMLRTGTYIIESTYTLTGANQIWTGDIAAFQQFRVRLNPVITGSGTANIIMQFEASTNEVQVVIGQATAGNLNASIAPSSSTGAAVPSLALPVGVQARTTEATATTSTYNTIPVADKVGKLINLPFSNPENFVSNTNTATGTAATSVISAQGAGIKIYITSISIANTGTSNSLITIQQDPTGTPATLWYFTNPAAGGSNMTFPVPIVVAANKAVGFTAGTGSTTQYVSISGYTGA